MLLASGARNADTERFLQLLTEPGDDGEETGEGTVRWHGRVLGSLDLGSDGAVVLAHLYPGPQVGGGDLFEDLRVGELTVAQLELGRDS